MQLTFSSPSSKSKAENYRKHILQAFESVVSSPVILEMRYESVKDEKLDREDLRVSENRYSRMKAITLQDRQLRLGPERPLSTPRDHAMEGGSSSTGKAKSEIVEVGEVRVGNSEKRGGSEKLKDQSLVKNKVSLAHVIQRGDGWSTRKAISIAEKLEQENL